MEETIQNLATQKLQELLLLCGIGNDNDKVIVTKKPLIIQISDFGDHTSLYCLRA